jgi:hypothetical protein
MSFPQRIASIFIAPVKLMQNIKTYPAVGSMLFLVMGLSLLAIPFLAKITELTTNLMAEIMLARHGEAALAYMEIMQASANSQAASIVTTISAAASAMVAYPMTCVILGFVLLIITKIARGSAKYLQYISMYAHVTLITVIGALFATIMMAALGAMLHVSSLAAIFMPNGNFSMMSFNILNSITLFSILEGVLLVIGVREINGFSTAKAAVLVVIMYILTLIFAAAAAGSSIMILDFTLSRIGI